MDITRAADRAGNILVRARNNTDWFHNAHVYYYFTGKLNLGQTTADSRLRSAGLPPGASPKLWNDERTEAILALHQAYIDAGAQVILTNTFGGSRIKLAKQGLVDRVRELNLAGAALARQAAGRRAYMAGDLGPTGELMEPYGRLTFGAAVEAFAEQAALLAEGGVDAIWIETMTDLEEAKAAVTGARRATELPIFCSLSFGPKGRTMMGNSARQAAQELWPLGLDAIGANCGEGLDVVEIVLNQFREALPNAHIITKPNAGLPKMVAGQTVYDTGPGLFADRLVEFSHQGARILGACCGSSPEFIAALARRL
jgi:5-methyltetrahydrofolate--homocysteine methyltransferase